jgi:hypothetical protein
MQTTLPMNGSGKPLTREEIEKAKVELEEMKQKYGPKESQRGLMTKHSLYSRDNDLLEASQPRWRSAEASTEKSYMFPLSKRRKRKTAIFSTAVLYVVLMIFLRNDTRRELELRHPLRRTEAAEPEQIRYISFGSSSTWGEGLQDPLTASYPYRLSPQANNAASRVGGSAISAACTQSVVGNSVYDVVTIEFTEFDYSLAVLAQRIRQRLPAASIIFVQLWNPEMIRYRGDNAGEPIMDLKAWRHEHGSYSLNSKELHTKILATEKERWFMEVPENKQLLEQTRQEVQGKVYTLPYPSSGNDFAEFTAMFQDEHWSHLSKSGHEVVANAIRDLVQKDLVLERPNRNEIGSWGSGDQCNMWYVDGNYAEEHLRTRQVEFAHETGSHKHALEILRDGGSLTINNPFAKERMLSLTYMTAGDEESGKPEYPRVRVRLGGIPSVAIEPYHEGADQLHHARTSAVGLIPPGNTLIELDPLEDSKHNFRLVGVSILSEEIENVPIEFALEQESALGESVSHFW